MSTQYIYLLQTREFIRTKDRIYKVGKTTKGHFKRFNQYPRGSVLLFQMICNDCTTMENQILDKFRQTFRLVKKAGKESFEGDYIQMIDIIYATIKAELNDKPKVIPIIEQLDDSDNSDEELSSIINRFKIAVQPKPKFKHKPKSSLDSLLDEISQIFPDYKNDESFEGSKKYVIFNNDIIIYIDPDLHKYIDTPGFMPIHFQPMDKSYSIDELRYYKKLFHNKTLEYGKIYDINSEEFRKIIIATKIHINVEYYDDFKKTIPFIDDVDEMDKKIIQLFCCNTVINDDLFATTYNETIQDFEAIKLDIGFKNYVSVILYQINSKIFDYETLKLYLPYKITFINEDFYISNVFNKLIGLDFTYITSNECVDAYIFDQKSIPLNSENNYKMMYQNYVNILIKNKLRYCLNPHPITKELLILMM